MKTRQPLILTARISKDDLEPFSQLRRAYFPPDRNFLEAHLTMFHRLPGEYMARAVNTLEEVAAETAPITAEVTELRHLGAGVAFTIASPHLDHVHAKLRSAVISWLGGQDMQRWKPHITIQNNVSRFAADGLYHRLAADFRPWTIAIIGFDLWRYLDGPWAHQTTVLFSVRQTGTAGALGPQT